ncbi:hypothetical protein V6Z11_A10G219600, partial [Gossypium hirsutum]
NHCNWTGITCNNAGSFTNMTLREYELKLSGTLHNLNFFYFPNLIWLQLQNNSLYGFIPSHIGNLSNLKFLDLSYNNFSGNIPLEIGLLKRLSTISLGYNSISCSFPREILNLTKLDYLDLVQNNFFGSIPSDIGRLSSLSKLFLYQNHLTGTIPKEIGMIRSLLVLDLSNHLCNNLSGSIPSEIGMLKSLFDLQLSNNNITGVIPDSIGNLTNLENLVLHFNRLFGSIPTYMSHPNLSPPMASHCLSSLVPQTLNNLNCLRILVLSDNHLSGSLPENASRELLTGNISEAFGIYPNLNFISLSKSNIFGEISPNWGECHNLTSLHTSNNNISRKIPFELGHAISKLEQFDLASNNFSGPIPDDLGNCVKFFNLNLSKNNHEESISSSISYINALESLDLSQNSLIGVLNLSHNMLNGSIPEAFNDLRGLIFVNISFNQFEGPIPNLMAFHEASFDALRNNKGLRGNATGLMAYASTLWWSTFAIFIGWKVLRDNIIEATEDFSSDCCFGTGGYGSVYKAALPTGQVVAVKKLHRSEDNILINNLKAFESEIIALLKIRHRNIVQMYDFCSHPKHSFLVYELVERGSLRMVLSNNEEAKELDWKNRLNVVKGLANALSYMHHGHLQRIVHRDISSNNVLLDLDYEARVSDFGTARILKPDSSNWTSLAGTYGYIAPVLMGRHPSDRISYFSSLESTSSSTLNDQQVLLKDTIDQRLSPPVGQSAEDLVSTMRIALACLNGNPQLRPTMQQVSQPLGRQSHPLLSPFRTIKLEELLGDVVCNG